MTKAFLDTSGWFAALNPREAQHAKARAKYRDWIDGGVALVTTNLVVAEMQILLMRFRGAADCWQMRWCATCWTEPGGGYFTSRMFTG